MMIAPPFSGHFYGIYKFSRVSIKYNMKNVPPTSIGLLMGFQPLCKSSHFKLLFSVLLI